MAPTPNSLDLLEYDYNLNANLNFATVIEIDHGSKECMLKIKSQQPAQFLLFTAFNIKTFPMCHVISCQADLSSGIQPMEESKPDLPFLGSNGEIMSCAEEAKEIYEM
ncbi:hypothetical protein llap_16029 [Limosa lapponica baueri]|uniref:Uncharacterized protein n=1 Tax=Limosa lapponica baueri TaxID=1758121 RepID=A0A2I0TIM3_LIMLA|nr:hypothetical protein llap_16029 [Limosa lapponica baueri]